MSIETTIKKVTAYEPTELFGADKAESIIAEIRAEAMSYAPDLSTDASRKQIASVAAKVAKAKVAIDSIGKKLVDPIKAQAKVIDAERRIYKDELDALKEEVRAPLTEWEREQAKIIEDQKQRVFELEQATETSNSIGDVFPVEKLQQKLDFIEACSGVLDTETYGAMLDKARQLVEVGTAKVSKAIEMRKTLDAAAAQQAAANAETPAQRAEREREIADKAATDERAKIESENARKLAEGKKRMADGAHVKKVKTEAWQSLVEALPDVDGEASKSLFADIIRAIADGKVQHVSIQF